MSDEQLRAGAKQCHDNELATCQKPSTGAANAGRGRTSLTSSSSLSVLPYTSSSLCRSRSSSAVYCFACAAQAISMFMDLAKREEASPVSDVHLLCQQELSQVYSA